MDIREPTASAKSSEDQLSRPTNEPRRSSGYKASSKLPSKRKTKSESKAVSSVKDDDKASQKAEGVINGIILENQVNFQHLKDSGTTCCKKNVDGVMIKIMFLFR